MCQDCCLSFCLALVFNSGVKREEEVGASSRLKSVLLSQMFLLLFSEMGVLFVDQK